MTNEQRLTRVRALEEIAKRMNNGDQAEALSICNELIISLLDESTAEYERKIGNGPAILRIDARNDGCCVALQRGCSVRGLSNDLASKPHNWDVIDFAVYDNAALILKLGPTLAVALDNGGNEREHDSI